MQQPPPWRGVWVGTLGGCDRRSDRRHRTGNHPFNRCRASAHPRVRRKQHRRYGGGVARLSRRGRRHQRNGDTGSADAGKRCGRSGHRPYPNRRRRRVRPGARVAATGVAKVVQETTSDVEDVVDQIGTSQDNVLGLVRRDPSSTQDAGPLHAQAREGIQTEDATPPLKPRSLVRNSFKAVVGGSNAAPPKPTGLPIAPRLSQRPVNGCSRPSTRSSSG